MENNRELKRFSREISGYEIAGAIYSHGDVVSFVDGNDGWVVIADTCGHDPDSGRNMKIFLDEQIRGGWGNMFGADVKQELADLGRKLYTAGTGRPEIPRKFTGEWWDHPEFNCAKLTPDRIYLSGAQFRLVRDNGTRNEVPITLDTVKQIKMMTPMHFMENLETRAVYETTLRDNDILMMSSDGIHNLLYNRFRYKEYEDMNLALCEVLAEQRQRSILKVRETIIERFGHHLIPGLFCDGQDDVTLILIKRLKNKEQ